MLTPEQAKARLGRIGSSDCCKILGLSPYGKKSKAQQRRDAYFDILQLSPRKESNSMRDGVFMEHAVAEFADWKLGLPLKRHTQHIRQHHQWQIASLDAEGFAEDLSRFVVEMKYVENPEHVSHWGRAGNTKPESIPEYVLAQVAHQMLVCGPDYLHGYVACYRPWCGFGMYGPIKRDEELLGLIHEEEKKFYTDFIAKRVAPPLPDEEQDEAA